MLSILRRKAASWITRIVFAAIIISFAFFFGYNRMARKMRGGKGIVATVNGHAITKPRFQFAYENTYQMYRNIFKGKEGEDLPPEIIKSVQSSALQQLVSQAIMVELGKDLGLEPTPTELADTIKELPQARAGDKFDEYFYIYRFLPYFQQKYGLSFEDLVAEDIIAKNLRDLFDANFTGAEAKRLYDMEKTKWTFERMGPVDAKDKEEARAQLSKGKPEKIGPITMDEHYKLFPSMPEEINDFLSGPVKIGEKWYSFKLIKIEPPTEKDWEKDGQGFISQLKTTPTLMNEWLSSLMQSAKVRSHLEE